jgi:3-methyladenine DNA glycosylase/8-oxoguanine DNA glycosylase
VLPDDEVAAQLQALPGVGPYAAAHIMLMLGRYDRLILDSWTRPTYARLVGKKRPVSDRTIERRSGGTVVTPVWPSGSF